MINFLKFLLILYLLVSQISNANLIQNGSFEQLWFDDNSTEQGLINNINLTDFDHRCGWDVYQSLPGWTTSMGSGVELQKNLDTKSAHGNHHVELDSHPLGNSNSVITQTVSYLDVYSDYLLTFYYKPKSNNDNDNGIHVFWYEHETNFTDDSNAALSINSTSNNHTPLWQEDWLSQSIRLTPYNSSMKLSFGAYGLANTIGGLIDNIILTKISREPSTGVSEPETWLIAFVSMLLLIYKDMPLNPT